MAVLEEARERQIDESASEEGDQSSTESSTKETMEFEDPCVGKEYELGIDNNQVRHTDVCSMALCFTPV